MVTVLAVLGVLVVLFVAAAVVVRDEPPLVPVSRDHADLALPADAPLAAGDLEQVRFGLALRGYRMSEVDEVLARLARELAERDARIAELTAELDRSRGPGAPGGPSAAATAG